MHKIRLSSEEEALLASHFKRSPIELVRLKTGAIRMISEDLSLSETGFYLVRDERTVKRWIADFVERRLASLFSGCEDNENASKLTREQKKTGKRYSEKPPPSSQELPKEFWDVPTLKDYVNAEFGTVYESDHRITSCKSFQG